VALLEIVNLLFGFRSVSFNSVDHLRNFFLVDLKERVWKRGVGMRGLTPFILEQVRNGASQDLLNPDQ